MLRNPVSALICQCVSLKAHRAPYLLSHHFNLLQHVRDSQISQFATLLLARHLTFFLSYFTMEFQLHNLYTIE